MFRVILGGALGALILANAAHAQTCAIAPFSNGTTADATQLNNYLACLAPLNAPNFTGFVGIGTTAPVGLLELEDNSTGGGQLTIESDIDHGAKVGINFNTPYMGAMHTGSITSSFFDGPGLTITAPRDLPDLGTFGIAFNSNGGATRMFIDSYYGRVGIGTTTPPYTFYVNGTAGGTNAWTSPSDIRLKKNIASIEDGLSIVEQLRGVRFEWRSVDERTVGKKLSLAVGEPQVGLIAQEVKKVLPEAVTTSKDADGILGVKESKIIPVLVEAVKQLAAANRAQKAEIAALRTANTTMSKSVEQLRRRMDRPDGRLAMRTTTK